MQGVEVAASRYVAGEWQIHVNIWKSSDEKPMETRPTNHVSSGIPFQTVSDGVFGIDLKLKKFVI